MDIIKIRPKKESEDNLIPIYNIGFDVPNMRCKLGEKAFHIAYHSMLSMLFIDDEELEEISKGEY